MAHPRGGRLPGAAQCQHLALHLVSKPGCRPSCWPASATRRHAPGTGGINGALDRVPPRPRRGLLVQGAQDRERTALERGALLPIFLLVRLADRLFEVEFDDLGVQSSRSASSASPSSTGSAEAGRDARCRRRSARGAGRPRNYRYTATTRPISTGTLMRHPPRRARSRRNPANSRSRRSSSAVRGAGTAGVDNDRHAAT